MGNTAMPSLRELIHAFDPCAGLSLPPDWLQGRTAYGGITAATSLIAARQVAGDMAGPLRSAQIGFVGPGQGHLSYDAQLLRGGRSVSCVGVDVGAEAGMAARSLFVFGHARQSSIVHDFSQPPGVRGPESYAALDLTGSPVAPAFLGHFELRPAAGALPVSGSTDPEMTVWVRHRDAAGIDPEVALLALADALPPAAFTAYTQPAPISSISWSLDLLGPVPASDWFLLRSASLHAADGYSVQTMQAWDTQGRMLLRGRQCVGVFA